MTDNPNAPRRSSTTAGQADVNADLSFKNQPGYLVRRLHQIATSIFLEQCNGLSITPVQFAAMACISLRPECDQQAVARQTSIDRTTINLLTAKLEQRGLLVRTKVGKRICLRLTEAGEATVKSAGQANSTHGNRLLAPLSDDERSDFLEKLGRLVEHNKGLSRVPSD